MEKETETERDTKGGPCSVDDFKQNAGAWLAAPGIL